MRLKKCKKCGAAYLSTNYNRTLCPACTAASRATSIRPRTCRQCGAVFDGGPRAWYCPDCREVRRKERDKNYKKTGTIRPLGSVDHCVVCGQEYVVKSSRQKYCPDCAPDAVKEIVRAAARARAAERGRPEGPRSGPKICVICGKPFSPGTPAITCSPECRKLRLSRAWADADIARGRYTTPSKIKRLDKDDKEGTP